MLRLPEISGKATLQDRHSHQHRLRRDEPVNAGTAVLSARVLTQTPVGLMPEHSRSSVTGQLSSRSGRTARAPPYAPPMVPDPCPGLYIGAGLGLPDHRRQMGLDLRDREGLYSRRRRGPPVSAEEGGRHCTLILPKYFPPRRSMQKAKRVMTALLIVMGITELPSRHQRSASTE